MVEPSHAAVVAASAGGRLYPPIGLTIRFTEGKATLETRQIEAGSDLAQSTGITFQLPRVLAAGPLFVEEIVEAIPGANKVSVAAILRFKRKQGLYTRLEDGRWAKVSPQNPHD